MPLQFVAADRGAKKRKGTAVKCFCAGEYAFMGIHDIGPDKIISK